MTSWLFDRDSETEPGVFRPAPSVDLKFGDNVYVEESDGLVGPFDHQTLSVQSAEASDEPPLIRLSPSNDVLVRVSDEDLLELVDGPKLRSNVVGFLEKSFEHSTETIPADEYFETGEIDSSDEEPLDDDGPSLQDVFTSQRGVERADFSGQAVRGAKRLEGTTLRGSDLSDTHLGEVTFENVNLRDVDFRGATLDGATFTGYETQLAGADFTGATLEKADFEDVDVSGCIFEDAQLREVDLTETALEGADFSHARMKRAKLHDTVPLRATFDDAVLTDVKTKGARFEKASFVGADLSNTSFVETEFDAVDFSNADMKQTTFEACSLEDVTFTGAQLNSVTLTGHDTENIDFERANLKDARLSASSFDSARFDRARLSDANLDDCDLSSVSLSGVRADGANFDGADLEFATLADADLTSANFENSLLYNCQLISARVDAETDFERIHEYGGDEGSESEEGNAQHPKEKAASVYQTLEAVYRNNSLTSKSLRNLRKRKNAMLAVNWAQRDLRKVAVDGFLKVTTGHGTRVRNLFLTSGIFILVTAGAHCALGTVTHESSIAGGDPNTMVDFGLALMVSLLAFTGFGYARFSPVTLSGELLTIVQSAAGVLFFGLLVFVFSTRASR